MANISNNLTLNQDIDMIVDLLDNLFDISNNFDEVSVVATTCHSRTNDLTTSKAL